jgi:hypothetical protein
MMPEEQENQKVVEAEILEEVTLDDGQKLSIDPSKFLRRMMQGGWRTRTGKKNISPKRVEKRRAKNKAARQSRKGR